MASNCGIIEAAEDGTNISGFDCSEECGVEALLGTRAGVLFTDKSVLCLAALEISLSVINRSILSGFPPGFGFAGADSCSRVRESTVAIENLHACETATIPLSQDMRGSTHSGLFSNSGSIMDSKRTP